MSDRLDNMFLHKPATEIAHVLRRIGRTRTATVEITDNGGAFLVGKGELCRYLQDLLRMRTQVLQHVARRIRAAVETGPGKAHADGSVNLAAWLGEGTDEWCAVMEYSSPFEGEAQQGPWFLELSRLEQEIALECVAEALEALAEEQVNVQ